MKTVLSLAMAAALAALPALAEDNPSSQRQSDRQSRDQQQMNQTDQQAQTPNSDLSEPGDVETLRQRGMSSPNVRGESVPENPQTGVPEPGYGNDPKRLEGVPRP